VAHGQNCTRGFTAIELLVAALIMAVVLALAIPNVMRSWNSYQLNTAAINVASILERARYEAIRQNTTLNCLIQQQGNSWVLGVDVNKNGVVDPTEPQFLMGGPVQLLPAGVAPGPASMGYPNAQIPRGVVAFDSRGAVNFGAGGQVVYVLYMALPQRTFGFRAVTIMPYGTTQRWSAVPGGRWHSP